MAFFGPEDISHDSGLMVEGADDYLFGLLHSTMFNALVRAVAGRLESRIRISADVSYNAFPFPDDSNKNGRELAQSPQHESKDSRNQPWCNGSPLADHN